MRRFIEDFKMKNIAFFLLFFLLISGHTNANAVGGSIGGWNVVSNAASGIGAKITATKEVLVNGAKTTVSSTANIMPDPSNMGKFMKRLGGAAVVSEAVNQLLNGVDYVMDPENNTIRKKISSDPVTNDNFSNGTLSGNAYCLSVAQGGGYQAGTITNCKLTTAPNHWNGSPCVKAVFVWSGQVRDTTQCSSTHVYTPPNVQYESIPIATVSAQIIDQAEQDIKIGNPASPAVVLSRAVAQDMIQEAEADDVKARPIATELDKNSSYPSDTDIEGEITTPEVVDPATGEVVKPAETSSIAMQFPKACEWFPQACLFIDWAMTDPNVDSDMEVPEKEIEKQEIKKDLVKISGRSCPSDVKFDVDGLPFGIKINKAYSMQEICNTVEPLKYVFELITAVICALILLRV